MSIISNISLGLQIVADALNILIALGAIYGILCKRENISKVINLILNNHFNERVKRLRETIAKLDRLSFFDKEQYREGIALFGSLSGQLRHISQKNADLIRLHAEVVSCSEGKVKVTEGKKNSLIHEVGFQLDDLAMAEFVDMFASGDKK